MIEMWAQIPASMIVLIEAPWLTAQDAVGYLVKLPEALMLARSNVF